MQAKLANGTEWEDPPKKLVVDRLYLDMTPFAYAAKGELAKYPWKAKTKDKPFEMPITIKICDILIFLDEALGTINPEKKGDEHDFSLFHAIVKQHLLNV